MDTITIGIIALMVGVLAFVVTFWISYTNNIKKDTEEYINHRRFQQQRRGIFSQYLPISADDDNGDYRHHSYSSSDNSYSSSDNGDYHSHHHDCDSSSSDCGGD